MIFQCHAMWTGIRGSCMCYNSTWRRKQQCQTNMLENQLKGSLEFLARVSRPTNFGMEIENQE